MNRTKQINRSIKNWKKRNPKKNRIVSVKDSNIPKMKTNGFPSLVNNFNGTQLIVV